MPFAMRFSILTFVLCTSGCALSPTIRLSQYAEQQGLVEDVMHSADYQHRVFRNYEPSDREQLPHELNVYLEGDGLPWVFRYFRMRDPTPRRALMLELMAKDNRPAIYIGRPCYNGFSASPPCDSSKWTSGRYSTSIVNAMVAILEAELASINVERINLFGHSGGGTLAVLMAERLPQVVRVVTLAGNLDIEAWIAHHSYSPLYSSLNPASRPPLSGSIEQIHFMGDEDTNIPPALNTAWVSRQKNSYGVLIKGFTHSCCWQQLWPQLLDSLDRGRPYRFPGVRFKQPMIVDAM